MLIWNLVSSALSFFFFLSFSGLVSGDDSFEDQSSDPTDDSPLISRGPGHIIRRTARTKVRKAALAGDGNGHRFPATRRTKINNLSPPEETSRSLSLNSLASEDSTGTETLHAQERDSHPERRISNMSTSTDEPSVEDGSWEDSHSSQAHRSLSPGSKTTTVTTSPTSLSDTLAQDVKAHVTPVLNYPPSHSANGLFTDEPLEDAGTPSLASSSRPVSSASNSSLLDSYIESTPPLDQSLPSLGPAHIDIRPPRSSHESSPKPSDKRSPYPLISSSEHLPLATSVRRPEDSPTPSKPISSPSSLPFPSTSPTPEPSKSLSPPSTQALKIKKNGFTKSMEDLPSKPGPSRGKAHFASSPRVVKKALSDYIFPNHSICPRAQTGQKVGQPAAHSPGEDESNPHLTSHPRL